MKRRAIVFAETAEAAPRVAGVSVLERLLRGLWRAGVAEVRILASDPRSLGATLTSPGHARRGLVVHLEHRPAGPPRLDELRACWPSGETHALVFPALGLFDLRPLAALARAEAPCALVDTAAPAGHASAVPPQSPGPALLDRAILESPADTLEAALRQAQASGALPAIDLARMPAYIPSMRRELRPWWLPPPRDEAQRRRAEDLVVAAAQKQALDFPAYVHAPIEDALVRLVCTTRLTPNQASFGGNLVAYLATALFAIGQLGWGIVLALVVGVLDGVDGKLARVKVETSAAGKLEHWFDTAFEVSWAIAIAWWLVRSGERPDAWWLLGLLLAAEAVDGVAKGAIILAYGRQIDDVARFDRLVRLIGGRRNVYVWIMAAGLALGRGPDAFALVAWWEAATAAVHVVRAAHLLLRRRVAGRG